jgi:hypothetical protein
LTRSTEPWIDPAIVAEPVGLVVRRAPVPVMMSLALVLVSWPRW